MASALIFALVLSSVAATDYADRIIERSSLERDVALRPVDLVAFPEITAAEFRRNYPELFSRREVTRSSDDKTTTASTPSAELPGQVLMYGPGSSFFFSGFEGGNSQLLLTNSDSVSLTDSIPKDGPAVVSASDDSDGSRPAVIFRSESSGPMGNFKMAAIQAGSQPNQRHSVVQN